MSDMNTARTTCKMNFNSISINLLTPPSYSRTYYLDDFARCKWSTNIGEPLLFIKYGHCRLLVSDVEKKTLLFNQPFGLDNIGNCLLIIMVSISRPVNSFPVLLSLILYLPTQR